MLKIETGANNQVLRQVATPVTKFDGNLKKVVDSMLKTMLAPDPNTEVVGIGLAAPQVGILQSIMIVSFNVNTTKDLKTVVMINPEILELSDKQVVMEEGCLSLPEKFAKVRRSSKVKIRWQNLKGDWSEKKLDKWDARVFLHEYDHLEGKLFVDYLK